MLLLASLLLCLTPLSDDITDVVTLQGGKEVECRVLFEDDERVVYKAGRRVREVPRDEVADIYSVERNVRTFLSRFESLDTTKVAALADLAHWAEMHDMPGEARNLWIRILLLDGENEQAWTKLGGTKGRKGWRLRVRGRHKTLDELREITGEWKSALELPTAHFLIKTNVDPALALDISIDLERVHQMYYDTVGQAMELYPFEETPEVHIYAHTDDAPRPTQPDWSSWYARIGNAVMVLGLDADRHEVRKSVVDLMLTNSFRLAQGNRNGALPQWAREGLGNAFAFALRPDRGHIGITTGVPYGPWFEHQAADSKPLSVKEVVNAGRGAFRSGKSELRFVHASYCLVFFLVNAQEGKYRGRFVDYLQSAFSGQGSASHFEKIMEVDLDDLDKEWRAFVAESAGH